MADDPQQATATDPAAGGPQRGASGTWATSPAAADAAASSARQGFESRPELYVAGAFVGAFALAQVLKRLLGDD